MIKVIERRLGEHSLLLPRFNISHFQIVPRFNFPDLYFTVLWFHTRVIRIIRFSIWFSYVDVRNCNLKHMQEDTFIVIAQE